MGYTVYGLKETRIILYADDGVTPRYRVTLQKESKEGLDLAFKPEGVTHQLGSGAGWARRYIHRGFRPNLVIKWNVAIESWIETWDGSAWGAAAVVQTAQALSVVYTWASLNPCRVSPHYDLNFDFLAQPDPGKAFVLQDQRGAVHTKLELNLIGVALLPKIPDWINLNNYFEEGYIDPGFAAFSSTTDAPA